MTDTAASPLADVNPNSLTELFAVDPSTVAPVVFEKLILEFRRRADERAAEAARIEAEGEAKKRKPKTEKGRIVDVALAAIADKPVSELQLGDLFGPGSDL